ncbi:MAG: hypothetical protein COB09_18550 [Thalassobium sp.]|nr:MAG: hypothetical protein COB09_18550 [Thalassobium sp.]
MSKLVKMHKEGSVTLSRVDKIDSELRLVFGWGQVCKSNGEDYFDTDNQHIPEQVALEGWNVFMQEETVMKACHEGEPMGSVRFAYPLSLDLAKSLDIDTKGKSGVLVTVYVSDDETLAKFKSGEYKDFSIGGAAAWIDVE